MTSARRDPRLAAALLTSVVALTGCSSSTGGTPAPGGGDDRVAPARTAAVAELPAATDRVRVSVIGDSFSAGSMNDVVWPDILAAEHSFTVSNVSLSGSGYVAGDDYLGTFADQIDDATATDPTVILVVGSENDVAADPEDVLADATDLYAALQDRAPAARIVVIGPIWSNGPAIDEIYDIDAAVETAALTAGLDYIDTLDDGWLADPLIIQDDGDHPTDEGQYELAGHIDDAVRMLDPDLLG